MALPRRGRFQTSRRIIGVWGVIWVVIDEREDGEKRGVYVEGVEESGV